MDTEDGHVHCSFSFADLARRQLRCIPPEAAFHLEKPQHLVDLVNAARADLEPQFSPVFAQRDRSFNGAMADTQVEILSSNGIEADSVSFFWYVGYGFEDYKRSKHKSSLPGLSRSICMTT